MTTSLPLGPVDGRQRWSEYQVVARKVNRAPAVLACLLADPRLLPDGRDAPLGHGGALRFDTTFEDRTCGLLPGWRARARLLGPGRRARHHVNVEIAPWSADASELRVVPRSHHMHRWGMGRRRRYWRLAHAAADHLLRILAGAPLPELPAGVRPNDDNRSAEGDPRAALQRTL